MTDIDRAAHRAHRAPSRARSYDRRTCTLPYASRLEAAPVPPIDRRRGDCRGVDAIRRARADGLERYARSVATRSGGVDAGVCRPRDDPAPARRDAHGEIHLGRGADPASAAVAISGDL